MYAAGVEHPLRSACRRVVRSIADGSLDAVTDAEVFQEILYRYAAIGQTHKGFQVFDHFHRVMLGRILPIEDSDVCLARELLERHPSLSPRDATHLAVMTRHRIRDIVTADRIFNQIPDVRRIDPTEL
jgi:predicted nucleic acid-binding protein